jgi:hypothetical protein
MGAVQDTLSKWFWGAGRALVVVFAAYAATACDSTDSSDSAASMPSPEERVSQRAEARWRHLIDDEVEAAYGFLSPGYRSTYPLPVYQRMVSSGAVRWKNVNVDSVACDEGICDVVVSVSYEYAGTAPEFQGMDLSNPLNERWLELDGEWWYVPGSGAG